MCRSCSQNEPQEWIEPVMVRGRTLPGTGTWRSAMSDGLCSACKAAMTAHVDERRRQLERHIRLVNLGGGERPSREFRFETYNVTPENERAFSQARNFNSDRDGLYLWGPCGVGKTHLAFAIARRAVEATLPSEFLTPGQLLRRIRRKDPDEEQQALLRIARAAVLVIDDLGSGRDTQFAQGLLQEILDMRRNSYRAGLVVTSKYSLGALAARLDDDTLASRLAGLCRVAHVGGRDHRLADRESS